MPAKIFKFPPKSLNARQFKENARQFKENARQFKEAIRAVKRILGIIFDIKMWEGRKW